MAEIKNIHLLTNIGDKDKAMMEHAGNEHRRHNNIVFKIVEYFPGRVIIQAVQGKNAAGVYHNQKRLVEIVKETFLRFFPGSKLLVHAVVYTESPATQVDVKWINKKMLATKTSSKIMADETGLNYSYLSSIVNGNEPLSQLMKAMFWYYFETKKSRPSGFQTEEIKK